MKITPDIWHQVQMLNREFNRRGEHLSRQKISDALNINDNTAKFLMYAIENEDVIISKEKKATTEDIIEGDNRTITTISANVKTEEDAIDFHEIDLKKWHVKQFRCKTWTVTIGGNKTGTGKPETYTNYATNLILERIDKTQLTIEDRVEQFENLIKNYEPKLITVNTIIRKENDWLMKVSFSDQHNGQLSWAPEAGENWDIKLSTSSLIKGSKYFASIAKEKKVSRILYPAGNDFLNVNSSLNITTHGTPQDEDCRYPKSFELSLYAIIKSIDMLSIVAPVDVEFILGNHDGERMFYLVVALKQFYRNSKTVRINSTPSFRKYYLWENNLIGLSHGDKENLADIPALMAVEAYKEWSKAENKYFFHGHLHHEKKLIKEIVDVKKVQVEFDPSLTALSAWAKGKGFAAVRKSKANLFHKKYGNVEDVRYFYDGE